jgi:hypothetical protein
MKIRSGFVSNSSSSSFCILGIVLPEDFDEEKFEEIDEKLWSNRNDKDSFYLETQCGISDYYDCRLIGKSPDAMKDDETLIQFKEKVVEAIKQAGVDVELKDIGWHIDGGHDG